MLEKKTVFTVATYHCDNRGRILPHTLMQQLQEIASKHADDLGVGRKWMEDNGLYWVLVNFRIEFSKVPSYGDAVMLRTWPSGLDLLRAFRDFKGEDLRGKELFRAASDWMVIDAKRMRPVMIKDLEFDFESSKDRSFGDMDRLKTAGEYTDLHIISVPYSSIDMNGHVNNTEYVRWGTDTARMEIGEGPDIDCFHITFLSEVFMHEEILLRSMGQKVGTIRLKGSRTGNGKDAFVMELGYH
ncbi:MAG: hypothetical protein JXA22_04115 [Candidatus Thermoplasmatota archaeon]|nr:hypothetical protein [Candidatus Thermoplasmatota archaeon]